MASWIGDLRYGARAMRRAPAFTAVAVITLALGIGANTAIFSVIHGVLLSPLPYPEPDRLVALWERNASGSEAHIAGPNFVDWREQSRSFEGLAVHPSTRFGGRTTVLGGNRAVRVWTASVSEDFFPLMRVAPVVGRGFTPEEARGDSDNVVLVSHRFWTNHLSSTDDLAGTPLRIGSSAYTVVGVMPQGFSYPGETDVWAPVALRPGPGLGSRTSHNWVGVARLRDGVTPAQARDELDRLQAGIEERFGEENDAVGVVVTPLRDELTGEARRPLWLLFGAAGLLLLIACTNVSSTLLARGATRSREFAIRASLGAGRGRLVRQLLTESLLLTAMGAVVGIALAVGVLRALVALAPASLPRIDEAGLHPAVLLFTIGVSVLTAMGFGLLPALRTAGGSVEAALRAGTRGSTGDVRGAVWKILVGAEVALAFLLLVGSGLLIRSFAHILGVDAGIRTENVLTVELSVPSAKHAGDEALAAFHERLLHEVATLPGVEEAGLINHLPLGGRRINGGFEIEGRGESSASGDYRVVGGDYFGAMGIPLVQGRIFDSRDGMGVPDVAIVNQALAARYWPDESPVGKRIRNLSNDTHLYGDRWLTIVGVVGDVRHGGLTAEPPREVYVHYRQRPGRSRSAVLALRTTQPPDRLVGAVRARVGEMEPDVPLEFSTMRTRVTDSVADRRFTMLTLVAFAVVALTLALVGIYGVVSYAVARRRQEIGIRLALGATPWNVRRMMVRDSMGAVLAGIVAGGIGAVFLTRLAGSLLFEIRPTDPSTFAGVMLALVATAGLATWLPARRSSAVDPLITMRAE